MKSMYPADLFLPTVYLSRLNCIFHLGVRKYLSTSSIADATKEKKKRDRKEVRDGGEEGRKDKEGIRGKINPYCIQGQVSAICCLALLNALFSS